MTTPRERPLQEPAQGEVSAAGGGGGTPRSTDEIQADIAQTRQELGETVEALTTRLDFKARTKQSIGATKTRAAHRLEVARQRTGEVAVRARAAATDDRGRTRPAVPVGAVAALALVTVAVLWKRRHR